MAECCLFYFLVLVYQWVKDTESHGAFQDAYPISTIGSFLPVKRLFTFMETLISIDLLKC